MDIALKIRKGEGPLWGMAKSLARRVLHFHLPVTAVTQPVFSSLYHAHVFLREASIWACRFFWYEPLFRSQCAQVGDGFQMERLPYLSGRGRIVIGQGVRLSGKPTLCFSNRHHGEPELLLGDHSFVGHDCCFQIAESVRIGRHCLLAGGVRIQDFDGHPVDAEQRRAGLPTPQQGIRPVVIGDDVWIGAGAIILKGVAVGARSIVGAGAVVSKDVPPDVVVAGNPARIVKYLAGSDSPALVNPS